jgi:hypothetical protein
MEISEQHQSKQIADISGAIELLFKKIDPNASTKAPWQIVIDEGTAAQCNMNTLTTQRSMKVFRRMLKDVILSLGDSENAIDWIGPLRDVTPKNSAFWEPVNTAFAAVEFIDYGHDKTSSLTDSQAKHFSFLIGSPEAKRLARIFLKEFAKVDAA